MKPVFGGLAVWRPVFSTATATSKQAARSSSTWDDGIASNESSKASYPRRDLNISSCRHAATSARAVSSAVLTRSRAGAASA